MSRVLLLSCAVLCAAAAPLSARDSIVIFNEVQYHPADEAAQTEWIELRNLQGVDVDLSGWKLEGGVDYTFPEGTVVAGRGFILAAQNPAQLPGKGAVGPWSGKLDNGGEEVRLLNRNGRVMDFIGYSDDGDWPAGADGSGATIARRIQTEAHGTPSAWAASNELGGTPGGSNFLDADSAAAKSTPIPIDSPAWKYSDAGVAAPAGWNTAGFSADGWSTGRGLFYRGTAKIAEPASQTPTLSGPGDGLTSWWAMDDAAASTTAANSAAGGATGTLSGSVGTNIAFVTDAAPRNKILRVNVNAANTSVTGSYVTAGSLPVQTMANSFTIAFWGKTNESGGSDVLIGNRYANATATDFNPREFIKFTNTAFEWHRQAAGENLDYADIPISQWIHHALVKEGAVLTYYRNGAIAGAVTITAAPTNAQPFFMGGNGTQESWSGWLDDVAMWNKAVPAAAVAALATGTYTPATLPTILNPSGNGPYPIPAEVVFPETATPLLTDDFTGAAIDAGKWTTVDQGLEGTAVSGLNAAQADGKITFSGATTVNYWAGKSVRSVATFPAASKIVAEVDRVSISGTGTAFRSSLWLWADSSHYLHFSQNVNEGGWTWNANDAGGTGTLNPIGGGNNLTALDSADASLGAAKMKLVWIPGAAAGQGSIQIWRDAVLAATHTVSNWPSAFRVILTGQARGAGDTVTAVFDNLSVSSSGVNPLQTVVQPAMTHYFRHSFNLSGDPAGASLTLWPIHDDAVVYYLNGVEVYRDNIPASPSYSTPATASVTDPYFPQNAVVLPAGSLQRGSNVLAVEVHQDSAASPDMLFGAQLSLTELPAPPRDTAPSLVLSEISGAADVLFRVELQNLSTGAMSLDGVLLRSSSGASFSLTGSLAAGAYLVLDETALGFRPADGDRLFLTTAGNAFLDGRSVTGRSRARAADGSWAHPQTASFGSGNVIDFHDEIVINEIMYNAPGDSPEQWIELYNRGGQAVDLSGWHFTDGISFTFPDNTPPLTPGQYAVVAWDAAAFNVLHPGVPRVYGPFTQNLSGKGERLRLRDSEDNLADEVRYAEGGAWPLYTSRTSSSLELRNPLNDNSIGSAWAASNESGRAPWQNVTYQFTGAVRESDPNYYSELVLGLLNDGEVLIDDISVRENPDGTNTELIQNGTFTGGTLDKWRLEGNHRRSVLMDDPDSPGNKVLRIVAGGSTDHMSNHLETTLMRAGVLMGTGGINTGAAYRISFRARWWKGNNALHSRLYFNRGAQTTVLNRPSTGGTPGARNSTYDETGALSIWNANHTPAVPAVQQGAVVSIQSNDPYHTAIFNLYYTVNGGPELTIFMTKQPGNIWTATIPGQAASAKVVYRVHGISTHGDQAHWPADGYTGRAMIPWNDNQAQLVRPSGARPHNVRIVITAADTTLLHAANNVMSNDWMPCTVIYDEKDVYYGTKVHLKGSEHGRAKDSRAGFLLTFPPERLFLGASDEVAIDRSGAGDQFSQKEVLVKHTLNHAGGIPVTQDDLIRVIAPRTQHTGPAMFVKTRIDSDEFLDSQFENGSDGTMFEYELIYALYSGSIASSTDNGSLEGHKLTQDGPGPGGVSLRKLNPGLTKEEYRWYWLIKNNRSRDDYSKLIPALTALGNNSGFAPLLDIPGWLRSFSGGIAWGVGDNYATGSQHNMLIYGKPDGKMLYIPWDLDFTASNGATSPLTGNGELGKMIASGVNKRLYYGYLLDLCNRSFNPGYLGKWMTHYSKFVNEDLNAGFLTFVTQRETYIRNQVALAVPSVPFRITTNSGNDFSTATSTTTLAGDGWVNVDTIRLIGGQPLNVTWTDQDSWSLTLPVMNGPNDFKFEAVNPQGTVVGTDSIIVTGTGGIVPAAAANIVVSELNYHPVVAGEEFIEMQNISAFTVDLSGCTFTAGITYTFPAAVTLAPGARLILAESRTAFQTRYPGVTGLAPGEFAPSNLSNSGETLTLRAADGLSDVFSFAYSDSLDAADGGGRSLVRSLAGTPNPAEYIWRESTADGGNPGATDAARFTGNPAADIDGDGWNAMMEYAFGTNDNDAASKPAGLQLVEAGHGLWDSRFTSAAAADDVIIVPEVTSSLSAWNAAGELPLPVPAFERGASTGGLVSWQSFGTWTEPRTFLRLRVQLR